MTGFKNRAPGYSSSNEHQGNMPCHFDLSVLQHLTSIQQTNMEPIQSPSVSIQTNLILDDSNSVYNQIICENISEDYLSVPWCDVEAVWRIPLMHEDWKWTTVMATMIILSKNDHQIQTTVYTALSDFDLSVKFITGLLIHGHQFGHNRQWMSRFLNRYLKF